jgi:AraC family transcriptional regulator
MELLAHARIVMWEGAGLWVVDATRLTSEKPRRTDLHAHHAIQITIGLGGEFKLATADAEVDGDVVSVNADVGHVFEAEGLVAFVFVEPESRAGRSIARKLFRDSNLVATPRATLGDFPTRIAAAFRSPKRDDAALIELGRAFVASFAADAAAPAPDVRIRRMIVWAGERLGGPISLADAVAASGLSASRLRHLFVEQTGLPFKTYVLWLRLIRALEGFAAGSPLTQVAHEAGFSDSSHLTRTFRRMFGVAPTSLRMS